MLPLLLPLLVALGVVSPPSPTPPVEVAEARSASDETREIQDLLTRVWQAERAGDLATARATIDLALARLTGSPGHIHEAHVADLLWELGRAAYRVRGLDAARLAWSHVRDYRESSLEEEDPDLQRARQGVAIALAELGDLHAARELEERVVAAYERLLPPDHLDLLLARENLAVTRRELGDLEGARLLQEDLLRRYSSLLHPGSACLQRVRHNLSLTLHDMGDLLGARALEERVLHEVERELHRDHPRLQLVRRNLAATLKELGELEAALRLEDLVLEVYARTLPADHPARLAARLNRAGTLRLAGDLQGALVEEQDVVRALEASVPAEHPRLLLARQNLGVTLLELGALEPALHHFDDIVRVLRRDRLDEDPFLRSARTNRLWTLARLERWSEVAPELQRLILGLDDWVSGGLLLSSRAARERADAARAQLATVLSLAPQCVGVDSSAEGPAGREELAPQVFELVENLRSVTTTGYPLGALDEDTRALRERSLQLRRRVDALVARLASEEPAARPAATDLVAGALQRDRAEAAWKRAMVERGRLGPAIELHAVVRALPADGAAVAYRTYRRWSRAQGGERPEPCEALLAHVVRPDGTLTRVELGALDEIAGAVDAWRARIGEPVGRGLKGKRDSLAGNAPGERLRSRVLDPLLPHLHGVTRLFACLDGPLHLVPLDALPFPDRRNPRALVGDRLAIHTEVSLARLLAPASTAPASTPASLLAVGGVDFDADLPLETRESASLAIAMHAPNSPASPSLAVLRAPGERFTPLPFTEVEVRALAELFTRRFDAPARLLLGSDATREAFVEHAPLARFLHVATHGYFADARVRCRSDSVAPCDAGPSRMSADQAVVGLASMTLCGLTFAGANRPRGDGSTAGILTAEELFGLDLSRCELAVLSACETYVGRRRAGQGVRSLQAALHAAGVRTAVTSLWNVPDELTKELMEEFYRRVWFEDQPKAEALWSAKNVLRARGEPLRHFAGWILTGDPR